eukprot:2306576-Prymnesium_polylepis.1
MLKQRMQQRFLGEQGLNGGVNRLIVERFIRAVPPWEHIPLLPDEPKPEARAAWLATFAKGLQGSSSLGLVTPALASRLASELLDDMTRMQLPVGGKITPEQTQGEWLLLLEASMAAMLAPPLPSSPDSPAMGRASFVSKSPKPSPLPPPRRGYSSLSSNASSNASAVSLLS